MAGLRPALRTQHVEALPHVELAPATPVADAVGLEAEAAHLEGKDARPEGVERARRDEDEVALAHRDFATVALADGVVRRRAAQGLHVVSRGAAVDEGARLGREDVPRLGLLVVVLVRSGIGLVRVDLHGQVLRSVHHQRLDDAVLAREVAHDLAGAIAHELVERHAVMRAALHDVDEPLVHRDVERLTVEHVAGDAARLVHARAGPDGRDVVGPEQQRSHLRPLRARSSRRPRPPCETSAPP